MQASKTRPIADVSARRVDRLRFGEDDEDIRILLGECDLHSAQEALDLFERLYPLKEPSPKTRFFLEELFESMPDS